MTSREAKLLFIIVCTEDSFVKYLKLTTQENADLVSAIYRE